MSKDYKKIYDCGYGARRYNKRRDANPYSYDNEYQEWSAWDDGWEARERFMKFKGEVEKHMNDVEVTVTFSREDAVTYARHISKESKIAAIKFARACFGMSLSEAKTFVENGCNFQPFKKNQLVEFTVSYVDVGATRYRGLTLTDEFCNHKGDQMIVVAAPDGPKIIRTSELKRV